MDMPGRGLYDERDSGIARSGRLIRLRSKAQIDLPRCSFHSYASDTMRICFFVVGCSLFFFFPQTSTCDPLDLCWIKKKRSTRWPALTSRFKVKQVNCYTSPACFSCCCFSCCHWVLHWLWEPKGVSSPAQVGPERCWVMESSLFSLQPGKNSDLKPGNLEDDAWMECLRGAASAKRTMCSENWPLVFPACVARAAPPCPPSANTSMPHWHDWYDENCGFCLKPGHMTIKNSSFQNC